jgi:hypothetical protein
MLVLKPSVLDGPSDAPSWSWRYPFSLAHDRIASSISMILTSFPPKTSINGQ